MNDISKLPRWARNEIERLRANCSDLESQLARALGTMPTRIEIDTYRRFGEEGRVASYLSEHARVRFKTEGGYIDVRMTTRGRVAIDAESTYSKVLAVLPRASNAFELAIVSEPT